MATDIKLDDDKVTVEGRLALITDLDIDEPKRRGGKPGDRRRALVHWEGDKLVVNFDKDYTGGVEIHGGDGPVQITSRTAGVQVDGKLQVKSAVQVDGDIRVAGAAQVDGAVKVAGSVQMDGRVKILGPDLEIDAKERRGTGGGDRRRALVHAPGDKLLLNWGSDYTGGVHINGGPSGGVQIHGGPSGVQLHGKVNVSGPLVVGVRVFSPSITTVDKEPRVSQFKEEAVDLGKEIEALRDAILSLKEETEALRIRSTVTAQASHYTQDGWRFCRKCAGLSYAPNRARSVCKADKGTHDVEGSAYVLFVKQSRYGGQAGWEWCHKCQLLGHGSAPLSGHCPAGGAHDRSRSPGYLVWHPGVSGGASREFNAQDGWRWCGLCFGLVHGQGACAAPGAPNGQHTFGDTSYHLQW
jgi:hypothetical protein